MEEPVYYGWTNDKIGKSEIQIKIVKNSLPQLMTCFLNILIERRNLKPFIQELTFRDSLDSRKRSLLQKCLSKSFKRIFFSEMFKHMILKICFRFFLIFRNV